MVRSDHNFAYVIIVMTIELSYYVEICDLKGSLES